MKPYEMPELTIVSIAENDILTLSFAENGTPEEIDYEDAFLII